MLFAALRIESRLTTAYLPFTTPSGPLRCGYARFKYSLGFRVIRLYNIFAGRLISVGVHKIR
jgi:hypothetical protein